MAPPSPRLPPSSVRLLQHLDATSCPPRALLFPQLLRAVLSGYGFPNNFVEGQLRSHPRDALSDLLCRDQSSEGKKHLSLCSQTCARLLASDVSISLSMSSDEILQDQLITEEGFLVGEDGTSHARLVNSASMNISRGTPDSVGLPSSAARVLMRYHSAMPPSRLSEATAAVPFQEESRRADHWQRPGNDKTPLVTRIESKTSMATGHAGEGSSASMEDLSGLANSSAANASNHRMMDTSDLESCSDYDALSQFSFDLENSAGSSTLEALSSRNFLHELENAPMDLNPACNTNEVLPALQFESLQQQLNEAMQSAQLWVQREAECQANNLKMAEGIIEIAKKKIDEYERKLDAALQEARIASQNASSYKKELEIVGAMVEAAQRDQEILQERLAEEVRQHNVTRNDLEATRRMADASALAAELAEKEFQAERRRYEETILNLDKLRKEAEERASKEATARREAILKLRKEQKYSVYTFQEIQIATDNFCEENKLGQGGYGPVYKGKLHHMTVAIKVLAREGSQGRKEFEKEVELLSHIRHPHLVMLLGACPEHGCIVYDYMANGSLEDRLYCKDNTPPLPWYVRFRICLEVATALLFLHSRPQPVVHRDLKPGNILLDQHFVSKISDVGVAKLVPNNVTLNTTIYKETVLVGTSVYIDPAYLQTGVVTRESDVYSLGIIMLQLLTGQKPMGVTDLVEEALDCGRVEDVLDKIAGEWPLAEASALAHLSLQCADPRRKHRPNLETKILPELERLQRVADMAAASVASAGPSSSGRTNIIPGSFFCPISQEIMENPHIAADGFTYEHDAIKLWLRTNNRTVWNVRLYDQQRQAILAISLCRSFRILSILSSKLWLLQVC
ncbi:hypothetical protein GOP47_0022652 [Adiantum capillus-veneris]|uniref:RING-type E3 ubiquitin transferase n=1 Tax=Adiantum capillus-veneris TaxID=13818 RepID=A0A9D4U5Z4_ADICA|nr:hypothetical protein GOP47_0022652 [Adiantum capillus-veneris]